MRYIIGIILFISLLFIGQASAYTIDDVNNSVYVNDTNVYLSATPHTIVQSQWVYFNLISKRYTGDIDAAWGFNTSVTKPKKAELYSPHWENTTYNQSHTFYNVTVYNNYTNQILDYGNLYNTYKRIALHEVPTYNDTLQINGSKFIISNVSFDSYTTDGTNYTITWHTRVDNYVLWKDISSSFDSVEHDFQGYDKWYYVKDVPVIVGTQYTVRAWIEVPISTIPQTGKYYFAVKPSSETIQEAILNEHFYYLDPWWNSSWLKKRPILINNTGNATVLTNYQVKLNVTYDSDMQADFDDIRVINDTSGAAVPYWIESKVNSSYANVWFNASSIPASVWTNSTYYLYYGNAAVSDGGSGNNTFILYTGLKTADYVSSLDISGAAGYIYEANVQGTNANIIDFGFGDSTVRNPANSVGIELYNQITYQYLIFAIKATVKTQQQLTTPVYVGGTPYNYKIVVPSSVLAKFYRNGVQMGSDIITNIPTANIGLFVYFDISPSGQLNWQFIRKYIAIEPTATLGTEEIPPTPPVQVQVIWWE